jgi:hypothetical protein
MQNAIADHDVVGVVMLELRNVSNLDAYIDARLGRESLDLLHRRRADIDGGQLVAASRQPDRVRALAGPDVQRGPRAGGRDDRG